MPSSLGIPQAVLWRSALRPLIHWTWRCPIMRFRRILQNPKKSCFADLLVKTLYFVPNSSIGLDELWRIFLPASSFVWTYSIWFVFSSTCR
jgi:hypothetical protein